MSTDVRYMEKPRNSTKAPKQQANAPRMGLVGPCLSYNMPPTGAKNAPMRAPGSTSMPATSALVPRLSCARLVMT